MQELIDGSQMTPNYVWPSIKHVQVFYNKTRSCRIEWDVGCPFTSMYVCTTSEYIGVLVIEYIVHVLSTQYSTSTAYRYVFDWIHSTRFIPSLDPLGP